MYAMLSLLTIIISKRMASRRSFIHHLRKLSFWYLWYFATYVPRLIKGFVRGMALDEGRAVA